MYSSLWMPVEIGSQVLEDDGVTVRQITQEERAKIRDLADDIDGGKG